MIVGAELADWLADPERQAEARNQAEEFARRWAGHPGIKGLKDELRRLDPCTADNVLAATRRFMKRTDVFRDLVRDYMRAARDNPLLRPHFLLLVSDVAMGILLYGDSNATISLGITSADALAAKKSGARGASSIAFSGLRTALHFLKAGGATLSFWEAPNFESVFAGMEKSRCRLIERRRIEDGESIVIDGRTQSFVIEHATSDIVYLQTEVHVERALLTVEYDSRTFAYVGASSTDEASSRVQLMVSLLRLMNRKEAAPIIAQLIEQSPFHTRWYLMRELLALDAKAAFPVLKQMADADLHPEVRATAVRTLELFFGEREEPARCRA